MYPAIDYLANKLHIQIHSDLHVLDVTHILL